MLQQLTPAKQPQPAIAETSVTSLDSRQLAFLTNPYAFNHLWRVAQGYSRSQLVPQQFRGKPDDCFIICQLALRFNVDPFMLMQSTYVVHGRPGFESKMAIALLNASGKIKGTLKTEFSGKGDDYGCRAWCIDRETGSRVEGPRVTWKMVTAERWNKNEGSKWNTMPDLMFVYRAAIFLIRTNYPEVLMGLSTVEENEDIGDPRATDITNQQRIDLLLSGADGKANVAQPAASPAEPDPIDASSAPAEAKSAVERQTSEIVEQSAEAATKAADTVSNSTARRREQDVDATSPKAKSHSFAQNDDDITLFQYREAVEQATSLDRLTELEKRAMEVPLAHNINRRKIMEMIRQRRAELRSKTGGNDQNLFDSQSSAAEM
jgi:hypothetical protein